MNRSFPVITEFNIFDDLDPLVCKVNHVQGFFVTDSDGIGMFDGDFYGGRGLNFHTVIQNTDVKKAGITDFCSYFIRTQGIYGFLYITLIGGSAFQNFFRFQDCAAGDICFGAVGYADIIGIAAGSNDTAC